MVKSAFTVRATLRFDCSTYRYSTSAVPVYYSPRPMVTGIPGRMICYPVFDVRCYNRRTSGLSLLLKLPVSSFPSRLLNFTLVYAVTRAAPSTVVYFRNILVYFPHHARWSYVPKNFVFLFFFFFFRKVLFGFFHLSEQASIESLDVDNWKLV